MKKYLSIAALCLVALLPLHSIAQDGGDPTTTTTTTTNPDGTTTTTTSDGTTTTTPSDGTTTTETPEDFGPTLSPYFTIIIYSDQVSGGLEVGIDDYVIVEAGVIVSGITNVHGGTLVGLPGSIFGGDINADIGSSVKLVEASVNGSVVVDGGEVVHIDGSSIGGDISSTQSAATSVVGSSVDGSIITDGGGQVVLIGNTVGQDITALDAGFCYANDNTVTGNITSCGDLLESCAPGNIVALNNDGSGTIQTTSGLLASFEPDFVATPELQVGDPVSFELAYINGGLFASNIQGCTNNPACACAAPAPPCDCDIHDWFYEYSCDRLENACKALDYWCDEDADTKEKKEEQEDKVGDLKAALETALEGREQACEDMDDAAQAVQDAEFSVSLAEAALAVADPDEVAGAQQDLDAARARETEARAELREAVEWKNIFNRAVRQLRFDLQEAERELRRLCGRLVTTAAGKATAEAEKARVQKMKDDAKKAKDACHLRCD